MLVAVETTVRYDNGRIVGFDHSWTFDSDYTKCALEGGCYGEEPSSLDTDKDGVYSRQELAELAQVNIEGLSEFGYFTHARLGETALKLAAPQGDYWLEVKNGVLVLHFSLPLAEPVLASAPGFAFEVYDPEYFIAFDFAEQNPITLGPGAPTGCTTKLGVPAADTSEVARLGEAFFQQFGGDIGITMSKTATIECPKHG